jgi:hypothetical protein
LDFKARASAAGVRHTQVMGLSGDIRTAARRVSWKVFGAVAAVALFTSCAVVALATRSVPPVLALMIGGLVVVLLAGLTLDALKAPFDRAPGPRSGSRGNWI